jgi:predicted nucleic acid-binding protein
VIFVDTSIWVSALRAADSPAARRLQELLDRDQVGLPVIVRLEILTGAGARDRAKVRRAISALPVYYPRPETWERIEGWIDTASAAGERFGVGDFLIASIANDRDATIWSLDSDFERMSRLGFVSLHDPAGPIEES